MELFTNEVHSEVFLPETIIKGDHLCSPEVSSSEVKSLELFGPATTEP
jgi:hypothetical protein